MTITDFCLVKDITVELLNKCWNFTAVSNYYTEFFLLRRQYNSRVKKT